MPARNRTYRPAAQATAAARPSSDGGWRVVFPPAVGTHNPRSRETTRVAPFANLHIGSFANSLKFSFSAKERDTETGLSYFGARYYSSDLSIWLSVDPMSGKYPSLSPYVYCANNPVKLVDPNGEDWYENECGKIVWNDNVTKKTKLPKGCTYIGSRNNDIVRHYGFRTHQSKTTTTRGQICIGEQGYHWTKATTKTDINVRAEVSYGESERVFKGIVISATTTTSSPGSTEGPLVLRGGLNVKYCGNTYSTVLERDNTHSYSVPGTVTRIASIRFTPAQLARSRSYIQPLQSISV